MFQTYSPNDVVNIEGIGYCTLINCGKHKTLKFPKKHLQEDPLKPLYLSKPKQSLYFDPESFLFDEAALIVVPSESVPIPLPELGNQPQLNPQRTKSRADSFIQAQDPATAELNIIHAKIYKTDYSVYAPDTKLSQHIKVRVKTLFGNRQEYVFYIGIASNILQLKTKIMELTKEPQANFDNIRLLSADGYIQQFTNNKELIYQTKIKDNSKLLFMASIRFSIDQNQKGENLVLSNNNRTVVKTAKDGKYELCLGTMEITNGKVYFETKIDKITDEDDLFIGFAKKGIALSIPSSTIQKIPFWGYNCMSGRKHFGSSATDIISEDFQQDFGLICKTTDSIGTLIQVRKKLATISYYLNGKYIGKAFQGIQCPLVPAVVFGTGDSQITINCLADVPFDAANFTN